MLTLDHADPTEAEPIPAFEDLFSGAALLEIFFSRFANSSAKGIDRLNGFQFARQAEEHLLQAAEKISNGSFRFSPYLENLKTKGRDKMPRLISIPTIRDRIVLHQLNKFLAYSFPESVPKSIASVYIRDIAKDLELLDLNDTYICGADIRSFYDSIIRDRLLKTISRRINEKSALTLVRHAIFTPTVPRNARRGSYSSWASTRGVPQGLAISNILAAIYLAPIDRAMPLLGVTYFRYVDDVLMYGHEQAVRSAHESLGNRLRSRGLTLHKLGSGKSHIGPLAEQFGYLGYLFIGRKITVRSSTIERLLQSLASKFSEFSHNKKRRLERFRYLNEDRLKDIFLHELNERISGAVSDNRRYGWIAYFNQINDLSLLHQLDSMVRSLFRRLPEFNHMPPEGLKRFARAYFEMKHNASGGYVLDYDKITTPIQQLDFLVTRGRVSRDEALTDDQIAAKFERYRRSILAAMHQDEQMVY